MRARSRARPICHGLTGRAKSAWRQCWRYPLAATCHRRRTTERDTQALAQAHGYFRSASPGAESKSSALSCPLTGSQHSLFPRVPCRERNPACRTISPPTAPSGTPGLPTSPLLRTTPTPRLSVPAAPACAASSARRWDRCGAARHAAARHGAAGQPALAARAGAHARAHGPRRAPLHGIYGGQRSLAILEDVGQKTHRWRLDEEAGSRYTRRMSCRSPGRSLGFATYCVRRVGAHSHGGSS